MMDKELREEIDQLVGEAMTATGCEFTCIKAERKALDIKEKIVDQILAIVTKEIDYRKVSGELPVLSDKEQDACTPTKEQLASYLAEPDDEVAANIRKEHPDEFIQIGRVILYGKNIAQAQRDLCVRFYNGR